MDEKVEDKTENGLASEIATGVPWEQIAQTTLEVPGMDPIRNPYQGRFWYTNADKMKWVNEFRQHGVSKFRQ